MVGEDDTPYLGEVDEDELASFYAEAVEAAVAEVIALARTLHAAPALAAYYDVAQHMSGDCPAWYTSEDGLDYWYDSCTTEAGAAFEGYAYTVPYDEETYPTGYADGDGNHWWGLQFFGVASAVTPEGDSFTANGSASLLYGYTDDGNNIFYSNVSQGFSTEGLAEEGSWLANGMDPEMGMYAVYSPSLDGRVFVVSGRTTVESDTIHAVILDNITIFDASIGSTCPEEPAGTVSILDNEGNWYDLVFDGPDFEGGGGDPASCDGCAEAWVGATKLGEACVDFSGLLDWDTHPFEGLEG